MFRLHCALDVLVLFALCTGHELLAAPGDPAVEGSWSVPHDWPVTGIHAAVLHSGKVLHFSRPAPGTTASRAATTDPLTLDHHEVDCSENVFCGGHSFLADGRLLVTGGSLGDQQLGIPDTHVFDPVTEAWTRLQDMAVGRWYPSNVTLADGRVITMSGLDADGNTTPLVEIFTLGQGWQVLAGAEKQLELYPSIHLLPDGRLFHCGPEMATEFLDIATARWSFLADTNFGMRHMGTSVLLPPTNDRILLIGGSPDGVAATDTAEIIDLADAAPAWRFTAPMHHPRVYLNAVTLPDGKVLVIGGRDHFDFDGCSGSGGAVLEAEMFDPATETWTTMAPMARPRMYHSTANLLADGRVIAAGTNCDFSAEIYSPPYLFQGSRPAILSAPSIARHKNRLSLSCAATAAIARVVLIRPSAATHALSMDQRWIGVNPTIKSSSVLQFEVPVNANVCPPGYYMLFLVDANDIPSAAAFLRIDLPGSSAACTRYGAAMIGSGGFAPELLGSGVPELGSHINVSITEALGGSSGLLLLGLSADSFPAAGGDLLVGSIFAVVTIKVSGPALVPGAGTLVLPATIADDPALANVSFYLQAWMVDPAGLLGFVATNGVQIQIGS